MYCRSTRVPVQQQSYGIWWAFPLLFAASPRQLVHQYTPEVCNRAQQKLVESMPRLESILVDSEFICVEVHFLRN